MSCGFNKGQKQYNKRMQNYYSELHWEVKKEDS